MAGRRHSCVNPAGQSWRWKAAVAQSRNGAEQGRTREGGASFHTERNPRGSRAPPASPGEAPPAVGAGGSAPVPPDAGGGGEAADGGGARP